MHLGYRSEAQPPLVEGHDGEGAGAADGSLLDEICDPLEAIVNLVFLLEGEAEDCAKVRAWGGLLTRELARVLEATDKRLLSR